MNIDGFAKKLFAVWMIVFFLSTPILGARVAYAQNSTVGDGPRVLEWIKTALTDFIKNTMYVAVITALINAASYAADRLAYDAAVHIATGGNAEEPLFDTTANETYLGSVVTGMAGEAIGTLNETIEGAGGVLSNFDLCAPSTPYIMLQLKLGIKGVFDRPEPKCDFNKMFGPEGTWTSFVADLSDYKDPIKNQLILAELANMYDPAKSEFGAGLQVSTDIFGETVMIPLVKVQENIKNSGFQPAVDFITGNVETPAEYISDFYKKTEADTSEDRKWMLRTLMADGHILQTMGTHAASVFTNTLFSKFQERIWSGLFDFNTNSAVDPFDPESFALSTSEDTAERYRTLLTAAPLQISNYSIISEFITCPGSDARGLYNCVADSNFVSAIAREEMGAPVTISEAIEEDLIDGSWPLIPASDVARNQDAFCYTYGFCYGNLVKLRKARVISIGWELAASSSANSAENPVTLQEVIDGFNSCGSDGLPDDNHPWCKMIDPDWVLKYPETQCRMQTNGELLLSDQADERAQVCVDMPSCIDEDEDGNCTGGYGYCVAEENTWRFRGESCPEYAASCLVFEDSEGNSSALLKNTVDPGPCTEDTVGCRWYATEKTEQEDGTYEYAAVTSIADANASEETYASRIYFNNQVEECDEEEGGCSTLIERPTDLRLNMVYNPSFEVDEDIDGSPDGWYDRHNGTASWTSTIADDLGYQREGDVAVSPGESGTARSAIYQPGIELGQARTYTLSFYARQLASGAADTVTALLDLHDETGTSVDIEGLAITGDCNDSYTSLDDGSTQTTGVSIEGVVPGSDAEYDRFTCTFTVPPLSDTSLRIFGDLYFYNFDGYIDSIQLEQGEDVSASVDGYSDTNYTTNVVKVAPAYLGCTGSEDDPEECDGYARVCTEQDMGCSLYTPVNGDPAISGIATELDECPAECAGYDTYRQEATLYEPDGVDSVYFIPDTATECAAEEVGCDEFTNLDTEEQEYYSFLRACVTEDQASADAETYYTWEGSDEDGYQLRTWSLLKSNMGSSSYTQIGTDGVTDTAPNLAPCSNWQTTNDGITCIDTVDTDGDGYYDWDTEDCSARADIFTNANCREFYDESGNIHYRDWENSVTVNNDCQSYRKTTIAGNTATEQEATCEDSGGYYVSDSGECRYYGYSEESTSCDESANGCRAYAGGRSRNSRLVLEELFEDGTLNQWDAATSANATYSNESLAAEGHSMLLTGPVTSFIGGSTTACTDTEGCSETALSFGGECTVSEGGTYCGTLDDELYAGKTYTVSVVAKGTGTLQLGFDYNATPTAPAIELAFGDAVELDDGWQIITLGPLIMDAEDYPLFGDGTSLVLVPTGTAYVDNIVLREGEESLNVIRDSWVTPASCDESVTGDYSAQYYLGCQEYNDQDGETAYLKSLSSLCDEDKVGCDAFFKTQESESTVAQTFNATCNNTDSSTDADTDPDVATSATACYYFYSGTTAFDTESPYLCTISTGETSCLFSTTGFTPSWTMGSNVAVSYGPETVITPADQDMFLVVTSDFECDSDVAGCTELGEPQWSQDRNSTDGADSVYLMNLPDTYDDILCAHEELFCDAFTTNDASTYYFKSPLEQLCEYRTDVTIDGTVYSGWFREGTDSFCYGTCEDTATGTVEGAACGSSADCTSSETCNAGNPSYVIGGTESGIWNNGDEEFGNWAGTCSATYDTCTEFQDKLAQDDGEIYGETDGTSYFYLNNDTLSEYGLSDSQKCNGQVSLKNGCAMFYDTGDTSLSANSSATEIASRHADDIFGSEPYGLVDPIDCENAGDTTLTTVDGTEIDLCATRCAYDYGEVYDLTDGVTYQTKLDNERAGTSEYDRDEMYVFGGSCYDSTDCPLVTSESGANIEAISCATQVRVDPFSTSFSFGGSFSSWSSRTTSAGFSAVPRQENDVNTPLKVNRDRSCAEWLSCSDTNTQWDDATASFITTCSDIALCKGYNATTGTSFCSDWDFEKPEVIYDTDWYASRDTSWYGNEYSGMAIPNLFPVQALTQADVSPVGYCDDTGAICGEGIDIGEDCDGAASGICLSPEDAVSAGLVESLDYALVLDAGACTEDEGEMCSVGYCEENGAACATSDQCSSGACIVGSCYTIGTDASDVCQTAADCDEGQTCYGGSCSDIGIDVEIEDYNTETGTADTCDAAETFVANAVMKLGSCINGQCLLTPDGETYEDGSTEGKICRAYPETTSPFPNEVVEDWYDPANAGSVDTDPAGDARPYDMLSGFENVETCAYGEDCDCSYTKVTFGEGSDTRFYGMDWSVEDVSVCSGTYPDNPFAGSACTSDDECGGGTCESASQLGLCQSGDRAGGYCTDDNQCGNEGEMCSKTTREDVIYGLNGFCLEKDTSLNILGDREKQACLSWLPVDELAGDTDLQAKYIGAGYFDDVYMCTDVRPFVNVGMSVHGEEDYEIACAESDGGLTSYEDSYDSWDDCDSRVACPDGFFGILGAAPYNNDSANGFLADKCSQEYDTAFGDNDCPFVCVPEDSSAYDEAADAYDTAICDPGQYSWAHTSTSSNGTEVYYAGNNDDSTDVYAIFDERVTAFEDCYARGVRATRTEATDISSDLADVTNFPPSDDPSGDDDPNVSSSSGYRSLFFSHRDIDYAEDSLYPYAGCSAVTQVASAEESYAWTDRIRSGYSLVTSNSETAYSELTTPDVFGAMSESPSVIDAGAAAMKVAQCASGDNYAPPTNGSEFTECSSGYSAHGSEDADPTSAGLQGRSLVDFSYIAYTLRVNTENGTGATSTWSDSDIWSVEPSATATDETFSLITQVFASVWDSTTWFWNGEFNPGSDLRGYSNEEDTNEQFLVDEDQMDVRPAEGNPPSVWAVNVQSCSDDGLLCEEGTEGRITVNSEESGDQSGEQFFNATVKFYAAADKNQLPIRRVFVDWGDDLEGGSYTGSDADDNYFKNSRGLQDGTQNSKCELESEWGLTSESCDPYYFTYNHIYTCSSEILRDSTAACSDSTTDDDDDYDSFPCWLDQSGDEVADACVFQPRVYVRDNWGWCTGSCNSTADTSDTSDADYPDNTGTCYDYDGSLSGVADSTDECKYTSTVYSPWVDYAGVIIVTP